MKKIILLSLFLVGCETVQTSPLQNEISAWKRAEKIAADRCFDGKVGDEAIALVDINNADRYEKCMNSVRDVEVAPHIVFKDLYSQHNKNANSLLSKYKAGKISKKQWLDDNNKSFLNYLGKADMRLVTNVDLCMRNQSHVTPFVTKEIKARGVDCYKTLSLYYQQQQVSAAHAANRQAKSAALLNYSAQMQSLNQQRQAAQNAYRPINTNCINTPMSLNCTTY